MFSAFHSTIKHLVDAISSLQAAIKLPKTNPPGQYPLQLSNSVKFQGITCIGYSIPAWKTPAIPNQSPGQESDYTHPAGRDQYLCLHLSFSGWESVNLNQYFHLLTTNTSPSNFTPCGVCPVILRQDILSLASHLLVAPCSPWFHGTIWQVSIWICCYFAAISESRSHDLFRD